MKLFVVLLIGIGLAAYLIGNRVAFSPTTSLTTPPITQTETSGEVTVTATYQKGQIEVALDTHSVDLLGFDFSKSIQPLPTSVQMIADSEHHRRAILQFAKLKLPFTLTISNLADIPQRKLVFEGVNSK
ncbi:MAG: hypothetical protein Q7S31_00190 [bacterium]|nr:hypothetical protein [bacterium]